MLVALSSKSYLSSLGTSFSVIFPMKRLKRAANSVLKSSLRQQELNRKLGLGGKKKDKEEEKKE